MADKANIDPRYLSYDKDEVEALLGKIENMDASPAKDSEHPVSSGGVYAALDGGFYVR